MRKGLPKADQDRIWDEAISILGPDRELAGARHWLRTDVIELEEPKDLLPLGQYYAMIRKLNGITGVEAVYQDNGVRAEPGGGKPSVRPRGGVREFFRNFLGGSRLDDI
jgi:hypothetical protein